MNFKNIFFWVKKARHKYVHTIWWFHLFEILKQVKLIYDDRNQTCGYSDMRRSTEKEDRKYLGWWNILYIDSDIVIEVYALQKWIKLYKLYIL